MAKKEKIAAILARVSRPTQNLESQIRDLRRFAEDNGYTVPDKFVFGEQISGINKGFKVSLNALLKALDDANNNIQAVLIWEITRLNRDTFDFTHELREITQRNVPVYFFDVNIWTWDFKTGKRDDNNCSRLVAMSDYGRIEWIKITERTKRGRNAVAEQGLFVGHLSDGYIAIEDGEHKKIVIDNERADIIKNIFKWFIDGLSTDEIAKKLNDAKIPTANKYRMSSTDKFNYRPIYKKNDIVLERESSKWQGTQVSKVLRNSWYKGERSYNKKIYKIDNIVSKEDWEYAQHIRKERALKFRTKRNSTKHFYLLADYFFCGNCGAKMYGHYTGKNNHYFCSSHDKGNRCGLRGINKENIEAIVIEILRTRAFDSLLQGKQDDIANFFRLDDDKKREIKRDVNKKIKEKTELENNLKKLLQKEKNIMNMLSDPDYQRQKDILKRQLQDNTNDIDTIKDNIFKVESEIATLKKRLKIGSDVSRIANSVTKLQEKGEWRRLVERVVSRISIKNIDNSISAIQISYINDKEDVFFYSHPLLKDKFVWGRFNSLTLLKLDYNFGDKTIDIKDRQYLVFSAYGGSDVMVLDKNDSIATRVSNEKKIYSDNISVRDFVIEVRNNNIFSFLHPYYRSIMKEDDERKTEQERRYKEWRKKYNNGLPSTLPTVVRDDNYDEYLNKRKHLYNRKYKIKKNKSLSDEQKEQEFAAIDEQLSLMKAKVKYLTREEAVKKYEEQKTKK